MLKEKYSLKDFLPLVIIFLLILSFSAIVPIIWGGGLMRGMSYFMGGFFVVFGLLKLLKLKDFATAYQMYDVVAKRFKGYAYFYPFLEVGLGIFFLLNFVPLYTNLVTLLVMLVSALGVYRQLRKREKIVCACLGTVFKVPITFVTLFEDLLMAAMAVVMIIFLTLPGFGLMLNHTGMNYDNLDTDLSFLPVDALPAQTGMAVIELADGDTFDLEAKIVKQSVGNRVIKRLAYNGQIPGPLIKVKKGATITVNLKNSIDIDTTLHSHGLRLDNRFDGVAGVTQPPIRPGEIFFYTLTFPDEGVYWYHPHIREDYTQDLGLYGNFIVAGEAGYWRQVDREEYLIFDDFSESEKFYDDKITHTLMGRFGDLLLINDQPNFQMTVEAGQINRLYLTNVANTRVFDLEFPGTRLKQVGGDLGRIQKEKFIDYLVLAPAERYVIETMYPNPGIYDILHFSEKIGEVVVNPAEQPVKTEAFSSLRDNSEDYDIILNVLAALANKPFDKSVRLTLKMDYLLHKEMMNDDQAMVAHCQIMPEMSGCEPYLENEPTVNLGGEEMTKEQATQYCQVMPNTAGCEFYWSKISSEHDHSSDGIEWEDHMPNINKLSDDENIEWQLVDEETGQKNMTINWSFKQGDLVKVRIFNDKKTVHPMHHPIHFHGQRFVVWSRDGVINDNFEWKDTVLVPTGQTVDIIVEMSNTGTWMAHCHIAEHLQAGMMLNFTVK